MNPGPLVDERALRRVVRRRLAIGAGILAGGLVLLIAFVVAASIISDGSDDLREHGIRTTGVISTLASDSGYSSGHAEVTYRAGSEELTETVDLGSDADNYVRGQRVTVYYSKSNAARMTIDDEDNQPEWSVWLMIVALVAGVAVTPVGAFAFCRWLRTASLLRRTQWVLMDAVSWDLPRGRWMIRFTDERGRLEVMRCGLGASPPGRSRTPVPTRITYPPRRGRAAVSMQPDSVVALRRPRSARQRERWMRSAPAWMSIS